MVVDSIKNEASNLSLVKHIYKVITGNDVVGDQEAADYIINLVDKTFFGHLKKKSYEMKKIRVLEIYRYLYRFSYIRT